MQLDIFNPLEASIDPGTAVHTKNDLAAIKAIPGLNYIPNFLSKEEHDHLMNSIYSESWLSDIKRRVQHYGWKYDYKAKTIDYSMRLGDLPDWLVPVASRLQKEGYTPGLTDQVIINEYKPGQGIANHIDCKPCFGNTIVSISLASSCIMNLIKQESQEKVDILLEPRSLIVIANEARYEWYHGIPARLSDRFHGELVRRQLRVSLTFRQVIVD